MKKHLQITIIIVLCFIKFEDAFSQNKYGEHPELCKEKLSEFYEFARNKEYQYAYEPWLWVFENCPEGSKNIYKYGLLIAQDRFDKATGTQKSIENQLIDSIFAKRIQFFPENLGKVYSDWASSLEDRAESTTKIFEKLEMAFESDAAQMSIKNLAKYFQEVTRRNKDSNAQKVFDTYDDALDAVNAKIEYHSKASDELNEKVSKGISLTSKEEIELKNHNINLKGLGQVEDILDQIVDDVATCERLIPLYSKGFDANKTNAKWLKRAASRLNAKECTDDQIFTKLVEAYAEAEPSPEAYILVSIILDKQGKPGNEYRKKAYELETDPYKRAEYLYKIGVTYRKSSPSTAASYARKALQERPSMGKAYLLIASAYAASVNSCGSDEFSKRMVYVAAANAASRASAVDPSLTSRAKKYVDSYMASAPDKKGVFGSDYKSGDVFKIGCWINETVKVP